MMKFCTVVLAGLLLALSVLPAKAQTTQFSGATTAHRGPLRSLPSPGRWFVSPDVGFDVTLGGDFVTKVSSTLGSDTQVFGRPMAAGTTVHMSNQSFHNVFDTPYHAGIDIGYDFDEVNEAALGLRWLHAGAKTFTALTATDGTAYKGRFNEYQEFGVDGVYRRYFATDGQFHPYVAMLGGLKYVPDMQLTLTAPGVEIANIPFYDAGWVWEAGVALGFRWDITSALAFGLEAQCRYGDELDRNLANVNGASGVSGFNRDGRRFDAPLTMRFVARF